MENPTDIGQTWATRISANSNEKIDSVLFQNYMNTLAGNADIYYDDIYIDNTWARAEIGNNNSYYGCTHREIQIPASWSDNSVTIKAQQGSFKDGEKAYFFIVDSNGSVSDGYPITLGLSTILPASPTNFRVK